MKPLRLQLENFASFRGEAAVLDFSSLELFAIAGPTGAGKSTLLDAIIFALYGSVPRLGRRANEMISLGADRMSVALDFRVGSSDYRVTRQARRRGAGTAQLEQLGDGGNGRPLGEGVREVNDKAQRIVGLSYDAFIQAVILPQGEFQRFLKSEPRERRDILSKILRFEIYERMRRLASDKSGTLDQAVKERQRRLDEDYCEATPQALDELESQRSVLDADIHSLTDRWREAAGWCELVRTARAKTRDLEQQRIRLAALQKQEPRMAQQQARLQDARKAAPVLPQLRIARNAEEAADQAQRAHKEITQAHDKARRAHQIAEKQSKHAAELARQIPGLEERMAALSVAIGRLQPRPGLAAELATAKKQLTGIERALKEARAAHQGAEGALDAARDRLHGADETLARAGYDRILYDLLDSVREEASRIAARHDILGGIAAEISEAKAQLESRRQASAVADAAAGMAREQLDSASRSLREVEHQLAEARHVAAAAILRQGLQRGEPCPVCEHPVVDYPPVIATPAVDVLARQLDEARRAEVEVRGMAEKAAAAAAEASAAATAAQQGFDQQAGRQAAAQAELNNMRATLAERVRSAIGLAPEVPIEAQVQQEFRASAAARQTHDAARMARDDADRAVRTLEHGTEQLKTAAGAQAERLVSHEKRIAELSRQITEIDEDVRKVTQAVDPAAERAELDRRRNDVAAALVSNQAGLTQAATELAGTAARLDAAEAGLRKSLADLDQARTAAAEAVRAAGFDDAATAIRVELSTEAQQQLSTEVESYRSERAVVEARVRELAIELGDGEVEQHQLVEAEAQADQLRERLLSREKELAAVRERIQALTGAIRRAEALRAELEQRRAAHAIYRTLSLDLRNDRFQAFLLQETFGQLVAGASLRLWELTQHRYRFEWKDEAFHVIDHDNARQMRSTDTLSGGETFLASLALALQLSDQVQKAAGATALDSLFIDEGFGTLDPEALDAATGAIENLPVGGRMVGIITHIQELSLRLPARVRVGKTGAGSRLTLEGG
jgi:exonuclease SbcC